MTIENQNKGGLVMKNVSRVSVLSLMFAFLITIGIGNFTDSHAWDKKRNPTQSGIKERGKAAKQRQLARWESLSPEQQEYIKEESKVHGKAATMTAEEYWNSLSPEEQQDAIARTEEGVEKGRRKWRSLPE
jgi:hypothetical protein